MESAANVRSGTGARIRHMRGDATQDRFGARYGLSTASVRNYETEVRQPSPEFLTALALDGWSLNWLLTGQGPERLGRATAGDDASQDLSAEHLSIALELTEEALRGKWLPKREYAEVVAGIYAMLTQGLPYADILDLNRSPAETKAKQGAVDGSRSESDPAREGADRHRGNG